MAIMREVSDRKAQLGRHTTVILRTSPARGSERKLAHVTVSWEGFWEGFAANRCKEMLKNENGTASNRPLLQRFAKESNKKQKLAKNLKTAGSNPLGVDLRIGGGRCSVRSRALRVESPALRGSYQPSANN
jgi:hypothetical protein